MRLTVKEEGESGCDLIMKDGESAELMHFDNLRNLHYCEIFLMCGDAGSGVYNTTGLNNEKNPKDTCPDSIMVNFSTEAVKKQYDVPGVSLNPPRYFLLDSVDIPTGTKVRDFSGLKARWMLTCNRAPYREGSLTSRRRLSANQHGSLRKTSPSSFWMTPKVRPGS